MPASIISLEGFKELGLGDIVCTSGGFDPPHPGHLSCIADSKQYGKYLVVIVNGDNFLKHKKGKPFMDLDTRCRIISYVEGVDFVVPYEVEPDINGNLDTSVVGALDVIRPNVFTKGGDRDVTNIPEYDICQKIGCRILSGVGLDKEWTSSDFLKEWADFVKYKEAYG